MDFLTPKEVSQRIRVSADYVYGELRAGRLESYHIGPRYRVTEAQLERWLAARLAS